MQANEQPAFLLLLTHLGGLYGKSLSEGVIELYWQALQRFEFAAVKAAFQAHVENPDVGQFMPKPADVVRILDGSFQGRALQAWCQLQNAMRSVGAYRSVVFDDGLIHRVVKEMGGWVKVCRADEYALPYYARDFSLRYVGALLERAPSPPPNLLVGSFGHEPCNPRCRCELKPMFFGDFKKAWAIYQGIESPQPAISADVQSSFHQHKEHL